MTNKLISKRSAEVGDGDAVCGEVVAPWVGQVGLEGLNRSLHTRASSVSFTQTLTARFGPILCCTQYDSAIR